MPPERSPEAAPSGPGAADALALKDKLYTLQAALDTGAMRPRLEPIARALTGREVRVSELAVEVIQRRNQRCVVRYRLGLGNGSPGPGEPLQLIGKVFKAGRGAPVYEHMRSLWRHGFDRREPGQVSMPRPLAFLDDLCLLVQEQVPGVPLKQALASDPSPRVTRELARVLVRLHQCAFVPDRRFGVIDHLNRCHPKYPVLKAACPGLAADVDRVVEAALERECEIDPSVCTAIHGDFHMGQIHLDGERAYLIDFDGLAHGDPAADLGNVLVFLRSKDRKLPGVPALIDAFLDEYARHRGTQTLERVPLYEALTHLRRACKKVRLQNPRWQHKARRMVRDAVACIERMPPRRTGAVRPGS